MVNPIFSLIFHRRAFHWLGRGSLIDHSLPPLAGLPASPRNSLRLSGPPLDSVPRNRLARLITFPSSSFPLVLLPGSFFSGHVGLLVAFQRGGARVEGPRQGKRVPSVLECCCFARLLQPLDRPPIPIFGPVRTQLFRFSPLFLSFFSFPFFAPSSPLPSSLPFLYFLARDWSGHARLPH